MGNITVRNVTIGEGIPKICLPIVGRTEEEILIQTKEAVGLKPDLIEFRADWYTYHDQEDKVKHIVKQMREYMGDIPLLFTFRTKAEGGEQELSFEQYSRLNLWAAESGYVDLADVEAFFAQADTKKLIAGIRERNVAVVASNHNFSETPSVEEMIRRLRTMEELGADIAKIAVMPRGRTDVLHLLEATNNCGLHIPVITMSMAKDGAISRMCGEVFGSAVTFGSAGNASAPGQIPIEELQTVLQIIHKSMKES